MQVSTPPTWSRVILFIAALGMLVFGVLLTLDPIGWLARAGVALGADAVTRIEMGAFYGGIEIGVGLLMLMAAAQRPHVRAGLALLLATHGGIGLVRGALMLAGGTVTPYLIGAVVYELVFALLALVGLLVTPSVRQRWK